MYVKPFGCAAYVLNVTLDTKFESCVLKGVFMHTLEHGALEFLVSDDDEGPRVVRSRQVTFDESRFPGAPYLDHYINDGSVSDYTYSGEDMGAAGSDEFSVDEVDDVMSNSKSCTSDHPDALPHVIVDFE